MAFQFDFDNKFEGNGIKDGTYEAVIQSMGESATPSGAEYIDCPLVIRNDIEQSHQNQYVFHKVWKTKSTGEYNKKALNTIGFAAEMDQDKRYDSLEDVFLDLQGKPVLITVKNETSEYNGKTYNNLNVKRWERTKFPNMQHQWKGKSANKSESPFKNAEITKDDLPF